MEKRTWESGNASVFLGRKCPQDRFWWRRRRASSPLCCYRNLELPTIFISRLLLPVPAGFLEPMSGRFLDEILVISMQAFDQKCFREVNTEAAAYWTLKHGNVSNI